MLFCTCDYPTKSNRHSVAGCACASLGSARPLYLSLCNITTSSLTLRLAATNGLCPWVCACEFFQAVILPIHCALPSCHFTHSLCTVHWFGIFLELLLAELEQPRKISLQWMHTHLHDFFFCTGHLSIVVGKAGMSCTWPVLCMPDSGCSAYGKQM